MAYILCDEHGGNIASLVSPALSDFILAQKNTNVDDVLAIKFIDENKEVFIFYVDLEFYNTIQRDMGIDLSSPIESEDIFFEISLELVPICSRCLGSYLELIGYKQGNG